MYPPLPRRGRSCAGRAGAWPHRGRAGDTASSTASSSTPTGAGPRRPAATASRSTR